MATPAQFAVDVTSPTGYIEIPASVPFDPVAIQSQITADQANLILREGQAATDYANEQQSFQDEQKAITKRQSDINNFYVQFPQAQPDPGNITP